ncbi:unnamed protein product [Haemonchus placei]|uniref:DUF4408 domain-containing protein n=1 Tax=Haemonchus placei TaxID=6290 RepID=A0A0N4X3M6_HAEPC|nr:unnamed protein product [Haemonchus placei]
MQRIVAFIYRILEQLASQTVIMLLPAMFLSGFTICCCCQKNLIPKAQYSNESETSRISSGSSSSSSSSPISETVKNGHATTAEEREAFRLWLLSLKSAENNRFSQLNCEKTQSTMDVDSTQLDSTRSTDFRGRNKAQIKALEAEMQSDRDSDRDKTTEAVKPVNAEGSKIKWADSKCVVFETSEENTLDDDEVPDEPDFW